jgi:hypothetical protein
MEDVNHQEWIVIFYILQIDLIQEVNRQSRILLKQDLLVIQAKIV